MGDLWLLWRMRRLGGPALPHPLVPFEGDPLELRGLSVTLTKAGRRALAGAAHAVQLNGIDDWVAGVHPSSAMGRVRYARGVEIMCEQTPREPS